MRQRIVAVLCEGEFWCQDHVDPEDINDSGYCTVITEFDLLCGEELAEAAVTSCCHGCGVKLT